MARAKKLKLSRIPERGGRNWERVVFSFLDSTLI
jgi:hypothetical protein